MADVPVVFSGPLTPAQTRFARGHESAADPSDLNVALRVDLTGRLDRRALERALTALVGRHHALRTRVRRTGDDFVQEVLPGGEVVLTAADLSERPGEQAEQWCLARAADPFELAAGPLVRFGLARLGDDRWILTVVQHHIITDGISQGILLSELGELYAAAVAGRDARLPPVRHQAPEFALWQRETIRGDRADTLLAYWAEHLGDADFSAPLPPADETLPGKAFLRRWPLPGDVADGLRGFARSARATLYSVLLGTFGAVLCDWAGRSETVVCTTFANRSAGGFDRVPGAFANTLPVRVGASAGRTPAAVVAETMSRLLDHADHQALPFPIMLERLRLRDRPGAARWPHTWFVQNPGVRESSWSAQLRAVPRTILRPRGGTALRVLPTPGANGLELVVSTAAQPAAVDDLLTEYQGALVALVSGRTE